MNEWGDRSWTDMPPVYEERPKNYSEKRIYWERINSHFDDPIHRERLDERIADGTINELEGVYIPKSTREAMEVVTGEPDWAKLEGKVIPKFVKAYMAGKTDWDPLSAKWGATDPISPVISPDDEGDTDDDDNDAFDDDNDAFDE
jgi:hypothetical protein